MSGSKIARATTTAPPEGPPPRVALIGGLEATGLEWLGASEGLRADLVSTMTCLRKDLAEAHRIPRAELLEGRRGFTAGGLQARIQELVANPPAEALWVLLGGEAVEVWGEPYLVTGDGSGHAPGLPLRALCQMLGAIRTEQVVIVLDVGRAEIRGDVPPGNAPAELAELADLPWPATALLAIGPGALGKLPRALTSPRGTRTAERVARALAPARTRAARPEVVLNAVAGKARTTGADVDRELQLIEYLRALHRDTRKLAFEVQDSGGGAPTLADVYVAAHASDPSPRESDLGKLDARQQQRLLRNEQELPTLHDLLERHPRLFVTGDPGGGKTTFLRHLVQQVCAVRLEAAEPAAWMPEEPLPVLVRLEDYGRRCDAQGIDPTATHLRDFAFSGMVRGRAVTPLAPAIPQEALEQGRLVLLLDGLDEVPGTRLRKRVARAVGKLASLCDERVRIVVTCRPAAARAGAVPGEPFARTEIQAFDGSQRQTFVGHWMGRHHEDDAEASAASVRLLADLESNEALAREIPNPLMLTIICVLFHEQGRLPRQRLELYHRMVQLLLDDRQKELWKGPARDVEILDRRRAVIALAWTHRDQTPEGKLEGALLPQTRALEVLAAEAGLSPEKASDLLRFFEERTGLLEWRDDDQTTGEKRYGFPHRTLAEYLVACRLATDTRKDQPPKTLLERAGDADWREITRMYACQIVHGDRPSTPVWALIRTLAAKAGKKGRSWADRAARARLAAECLAEVRERAPEDTCDAVDDLQALFADATTAHKMPAAERVAFWTAIGGADRRIVPEERWVEVPAGRFWRGSTTEDAYDDESPEGWVEVSEFRIQRWLVTVAEFGAFVEGGRGYAREDLWDPEGWSWRKEEGTETPAGWERQERLGPHFPVTGVSWWEARALCRWLAEERRDLPDGWTVRLPTEAEWEKAARGGEFLRPDVANPHPRREYPWAGRWDADLANSGETRARGVSPVGCFPGGVGPYGTWDGSGNVDEWCHDWFGRYPDDPVANPDGPRRGSGRVGRGGACWSAPRDLRVSYRGRGGPGSRGGLLGFRCVAARSLSLDP